MTSQMLFAQTAVAAYQEHADADHDRPRKPADKRTIGEVTEELKRSVNDKAMVRNHCLSPGKDAQIDESTEVSEISGCRVTFKTRKTTLSQDGHRELEFILYADLAELTTPTLIQTQSSSQCKPVGGAALRVMSRAQPGKAVRVRRKASFRAANQNGVTDELESQTTRNDVSLFFPDMAAAKKAGRLLERAVKLCGGTQWPDEDDLP